MAKTKKDHKHTSVQARIRQTREPCTRYSRARHAASRPAAAFILCATVVGQNKKQAHGCPYSFCSRKNQKQNAPDERLFTAPDLRLCFRRVRHARLEPVHVGRTQIFATYPAYRTVPRGPPFPLAATSSTAVGKQEPVASLLPPAEVTQFDPALHNRGGIVTQHDNVRRKMRRQFPLWRCERGRCSSGATSGHGNKKSVSGRE